MMNSEHRLALAAHDLFKEKSMKTFRATIVLSFSLLPAVCQLAWRETAIRHGPYE